MLLFVTSFFLTMMLSISRSHQHKLRKCLKLIRFISIYRYFVISFKYVFFINASAFVCICIHVLLLDKSLVCLNHKNTGQLENHDYPLQRHGLILQRHGQNPKTHRTPQKKSKPKFSNEISPYKWKSHSKSNYIVTYQ